MTGVFHGSQSGEACPDCGQPTSERDWTCRRCGRVLDGYLFKTITPKSVTGPDKDAFWAGYEACMHGYKESQSVDLGDYRPSPDHETAYRAGWQHAADKLEAKDDRKRGRRRGLQLLAVGALFTTLGGAALATSPMAAWNLLLLGGGLVNLALGSFALVTGKSDACPPDLSQTETVTRAAAGQRPGVAEPPSDGGRTGVAILRPILITWIVLALNILVFVAMVAGGVNVLTPASDALIRWGADFGPRTTAGEWWRLITSTFVHIGILHLVFNMFVLIQIGPFLERLFGRTAFTLIYVVAGIAGGMASLAWDPYRVSAGASGAIFGLYGALLGFLAIQRRHLPAPAVASLTQSALVFIGYNVVNGLATLNIDMAAHAGGLAGGLVWGALLSAAAMLPLFRRSAVRNVVLTAAAAVVLPALAAGLPRAVDFQAHLRQLGAVETKTAAKYNAALNRFRKREITGAEFASIIDTEVLPEWTSQKDVLSKLHGLPPRQSMMNSQLVRYMDLRREGWVAMVSGARDSDVEKIKEAGRKQAEAAEELRDLTRHLKTPQ
jgi:rhomboid protease GluP